MTKTFFLLLLLSQISLSLHSATLIAEYRFDQCLYTGEAHEVIDYTDGENNATVTDPDLIQSDTTGTVLNSAITLDGTAIDIEQLDVNTSSGAKHTVMFWMYWDGSNSVMPFGWYRYDLWIQNNQMGFNTGAGDLYGTDISDLKNTWHYITAVFTNGDTLANKLYIDGKEVSLSQKHADYPPNDDYSIVKSSARIGGWLITDGYRFKSGLDELKIYRGEVESSDIQTIYNNEKEGKNADGSARNSVNCIMPSPEAEYRFDSCVYHDSENEVIDSSGNDNHATPRNGTTLSGNGVMNNAIFFTGTTWQNAPVIESDRSIIDTEDDFTISFWLSPSRIDDSSDWTGILDKKIEIYITKDRKININLKNGTDSYEDESFTTSQKIPLAAWSHIVLVSQGRSVKLYVNDRLLLNKSLEHPKTEDQASLLVGKTSWEEAPPFYGKLDELKFFSGALTSEQIHRIYKAEKYHINYDATPRKADFCPGQINAEYRFDQCLWEENSSSIYNAATGQYDAIPVQTDPVEGFLNNSADFTKDSTADYISLNHRTLNNLTDFTISTWFKTTKTEAQPLLSAANSAEDNEVLMWFSKSTRFYFWLKGSYKYTDIPDIADNRWHMFTWTRDSSTDCLYIDGALHICKSGMSNEAVMVDEGGLIIGQEQDTTGGNFDKKQNFVGYEDELLIFNTALNGKRIQKMYEQSLAHRNHDGSHRMAVDCTPPTLLAEYHFDECKYNGATGEVIDSFGGDNSGTITGNITTADDANRTTGRVLKLDGGAVDIDNLAVNTQPYRKHTVMFWMYWDGSNSVMPFGWYLYDLWIIRGNMGFNTGSGDLFGTNIQNLKNGWHHITAIFTNKDTYSNRLFVDGDEMLLSQKHTDRSPNDGRSFVQSSARIGGWLRSEHYRFKSYLDELKIYKGELNATTIASIYDSEKDLVRTVTCAQAIFNAVNRNGGCFNWENNITTKIAGKDFNLTILAGDKNDGNASLSDVNITRVDLLSFSDPTCETLYGVKKLWEGNEAVDENGCFTPASFVHDRAVKCARIRISGIYEGQTVDANTSDTFAIRPKTFILQNIPSGKLTAEESYTFKAVAVNSDGSTPTPDFNQSITPTPHKYFRDGSDGSAMDGTFAPDSAFVFSDGATPDTTLSFDNVGIIGVELYDTTWAEVDADDTPLADRTIYLEQNLTFIPDRFEIVFPAKPLMSNYNDGAFTYYATSVTDIGANLKNLSFRVQALGKNGTIMTNYQNPQNRYFANDSAISVGLSVEENPILSSDINESTTKDLNFTAGVATLTYSDLTFNYGRAFNVTKAPLTLDGADSSMQLSVSDSVDTAVTGNKTETFDGGATFYYGRAVTRDLRTSDTPAANRLLVAVYSESTLSGFKRFTQNWYINKADNFSNWKSYEARKSRSRSSDTESATAIENNETTSEGIKRFDVTANPTNRSFKAFYHIDIPRWLWYSRYKPYSFAPTTSCAQHPCFSYVFDAPDDSADISSGDFHGATFEHDFNTTRTRKAVKILR